MDDPGFLVGLLKDFGVPVALVAYFLLKDWRFTGTLMSLLGRVESLLERLEQEHGNAN